MRKTPQPNAEQKRWRELVRKEGSALTGERPCQIHHPIGRSAKVKGVGNIGHWYVLALTVDQHRLIDAGQYGLEVLKGQYWQPADVAEMTLHEFEKFLFKRMCRKFKLPFEADVYQAIMDWHR